MLTHTAQCIRSKQEQCIITLVADCSGWISEQSLYLMSNEQVLAAFTFVNQHGVFLSLSALEHQ